MKTRSLTSHAARLLACANALFMLLSSPSQAAPEAPLQALQSRTGEASSRTANTTPTPAKPVWQTDLSTDKNSAAPMRIGQGDYRWFGFLVYRAELWAVDPTAALRFNSASAQAASPSQGGSAFALALRYQRSISREQFVSASIDEIRRLFGQRYSDEQRQKWQAEMRRAFVDVEPGDQLIGVYLPTIGCRFYDNNGLRHEIRDIEFAHAFFAIWLDPRSKDKQLQTALTKQQ